MAAIKELTDDVIKTFKDMDIKALSGELDGFQETYGAYDPDRNDTSERDRLRDLIDDSARVTGRMGQGLEDGSLNTGTNPRFSWRVRRDGVLIRERVL